MKNRIKIKTGLLAGILFLCSCNLDEYPYGFYSEENFYKTATDAEAAVNYAYGALNFIEYSRTIFFIGDMPSELITTKSDATVDNQDLNTWKVANFKTNATLEHFFKYAFVGINRANAVIKNIPNCDFDQSLKDQFLGEAYFLRAWNYFNLARNFGLVPMHYSVVETLEQTSSPLAADMDEIWNLIFSDCRMAASLLPVYPQPRIGRADKVAAQSLLAKAYLYTASAKAHNVPLYGNMTLSAAQMYDSAAYYAGTVITGQNVYGFENNLLDIYDVANPRGREKIFLMSMDRSGASEGEYSKISKMFIPYISGSTIYLKQGDANTYIPSHDGYAEYRTEIAFYNSFDAADKRKTHLIADKVFSNSSGTTISAQYPGSLPYPFCRKYIDPQFVGDKTSTRPFLIRFSDVALVYAEAAGPTAEAYALVNYIRNRAGLGDMMPGLGIDAFRDAVYNERTFEMAFEGDRMYDIRRWNRINEIQEVIDEGLTEAQYTFYPIPQAEVNLNGSLR
ncbi:MAG: RagB/SusD family nutrient uptake outer membrane protein [Prevotellaceae bacterium]|nr:RagB/SusD family nutrient uptake outer membrane protein [Prevotellaceae bacterium]